MIACHCLWPSGRHLPLNDDSNKCARLGASLPKRQALLVCCDQDNGLKLDAIKHFNNMNYRLFRARVFSVAPIKRNDIMKSKMNSIELQQNETKRYETQRILLKVVASARENCYYCLTKTSEQKSLLLIIIVKETTMINALVWPSTARRHLVRWASGKVQLASRLIELLALVFVFLQILLAYLRL